MSSFRYRDLDTNSISSSLASYALAYAGATLAEPPVAPVVILVNHSGVHLYETWQVSHKSWSAFRIPPCQTFQANVVPDSYEPSELSAR